MSSDPLVESAIPAAARPNPFSAEDIKAILRARGWLCIEEKTDEAVGHWCARAAELLGPQASDTDGLAELLAMIFSYDAEAILGSAANQDVLSRSGAREVIRELANRVLDPGDLDSDRFKEIVEGIKTAVPYRSRAMLQPIRLALVGRAGEGDLDRVILLLDSAARLNFTSAVKTTRQRMLEFCAALE